MSLKHFEQRIRDKVNDFGIVHEDSKILKGSLRLIFHTVFTRHLLMIPFLINTTIFKRGLAKRSLFESVLLEFTIYQLRVSVVS